MVSTVPLCGLVSTHGAAAAACHFGEAACMEEQSDMLNCRKLSLVIFQFTQYKR